MKRFFLLFCLLWGIVAQAAQPDKSVVFADTLKMDVYMPKDSSKGRCCILFAYGGSFKHYNQKAKSTKNFCRRLADDGYVAMAINYRLGMKGVKAKSYLAMIKPEKKAISMAAEDMLRAAEYVRSHADEFGVDPAKIVVSGSSAGAITALQSDYELCNRTPIAQVLPEDFRFAGVVSYAGAVLSTKGRCKYTHHSPAPTLFLHGKADKVVNYDKIALFSLRLSGSNDLVKVFKRNHYPHEIIRYEGESHGVALRMEESYAELIWFLDNMVKGRRNLEIDKTFYDKERRPDKWMKTTTKELY